MIRVKNLCKRYGKLEVLKGVDLDIAKGETLVILGRSGVGKSVTLRLILGLEYPDKGSVEINEQNISTMSQSQRNRVCKKMGMLFQSAALFDSMSVGENTAFYLHQNEPELTEKEIQKRVSKALKMVDMEGTEKKMPADLSGGMKKRVALARLIVYRPTVVLYDEPTTGLDPITASQINNLINTTQKELKATSVVVTHDIRSALEVGDKFAFHHDGKILFTATKDEFLNTENTVVKQFFSNAILTEDVLTYHKK